MTNAQTVRIQCMVSDYYEVSREELLGDRRTKHIAHARQAAYWLARQVAEMSSYTDLGRAFKRDHTSIMSGVRAFDLKMRLSATVAMEARDLLEACQRVENHYKALALARVLPGPAFGACAGAAE